MTDIPKPIAAYFDVKATGQVDALDGVLAQDAVVFDLGEDTEIRGVEPIKAWLQSTTSKYKLTNELREATTEGDDTVLQVIASGDFPGSPYEFAYRFTLAGGRISAVTINPVGPFTA